MPELPEVETVARQLDPLLRGQTAGTLRIVDRDRLAPDRPGRVRGRQVRGVSRLGKLVVLELGPAPARRTPGQPDRLYLAVHLRMTGRLIWRPRLTTPPAHDQAHLRAWLRLERGLLLFCDLRRFGVMQIVDARAALEPDGLDPLDDRFTPTRLRQLLQGSRQPLKAWLLRQDRLVGLGNIYASEILFRARLHPQRQAGSLSPAEEERLHRAIVGVLQDAVAHCGTTFSDFQDAHGLTGTYQDCLAVYGRARQPCQRCGSSIDRVVQQQRSSFFCPRCQPLVPASPSASRSAARSAPPRPSRKHT